MSSSPKPWSFSTYTDADGRTYVYGYRNRWDPEKKQSRIEKRCHVGRLDPQTGQVHLGRKFLTNNPEYAGKFWLYDNNQLIEQEPFEQPEACRILADAAHARGLNVWAYSGYTFEQLCAVPEKRRLLEACDVLVDGPFLLAERSLDLRFRGSKNQRVLKVAELLAGGE